MRHGAEFTRIQVPPHILHGDAQFVDTCQQFLVIGFALAAADNFADLGEEDVHGTYGAAVFVLLHIESLDFLGIIGEYHRTFEVLLDQITFVLALEVGTPIYGELEFVPALFKDLDTLGVCQTYKFVVDYEAQALNQLGVIHLSQEFDVVLGLFECK